MKGIPDYLKVPTLTGHKYGVLHYSPSSKMFRMAGEPVLLEFAKRLFPGAIIRIRKDGVDLNDGFPKSKLTGNFLYFHTSRREVSDLNWLIMRFPVEVQCAGALSNARDQAIHQWKTRASGHDLKRTAPPPDFLGKLYPFQEEAVTFMTTNKRCLLGDGMGLGKTWEALGAVATAQDFPVLIVCETHVQRQWQRVIGSLFDLPGKFDKGLFDSPFELATKRGAALAPILRSQTPYKVPNTPFAIIHYGLLGHWRTELRARGFQTLIADEVQSFRNEETLKYSTFSLLSSEAENVWGLSGTPVYGYGAEMWAVMNAIDFHCLGSKEAFAREWCEWTGSKIVTDPEALNGFLTREGFLLRRRASDPSVGIDLPPIIRRIQDVDQDDEVYERLMRLTRVKARRYKEVTAGRWLAGGEIERESRLAAGVAKAPYVAQVVESMIEAGERPLVFAWHHDVHDIFKDKLKRYEPSVITGKQSEKKKDKAIQRFIDGQTPMVLLSLRSTAGLDGLQHKGTMCINAELDWSPAIHSQCETRIGRMGVDDRVKEIPSLYCVSRSGYDETMLDVLGLKKGQFVGLMGDEPESKKEAEEQSRAAASRITKLIDNVILKEETKEHSIVEDGVREFVGDQND